MIVLRSQELLAVIDPSHGAELLELVDLRTGWRPLARAPFAARAPLSGDLDEAEWTSRYRGGWQVAAPNAGEPCVVEGSAHGFHGRASVSPWEVVGARDSAVTLTWSGHGVVATRRVALQRDTVAVEVRFAVSQRDAVPMIAVEHLAFGVELLEPAVELELAGGTVRNHNATPARDRPAAPWPSLVDGNGRHDHLDQLMLADAGARFAVIERVPEGRAVARNARTGHSVELRWDEEALPHLWFWHEARASEGIWRGGGEILGLEPASVPHGDGLQKAIEAGNATWVTADTQFAYRVSLRLVPGA